MWQRQISVYTEADNVEMSHLIFLFFLDFHSHRFSKSAFSTMKCSEISF